MIPLRSREASERWRSKRKASEGRSKVGTQGVSITERARTVRGALGGLTKTGLDA